MNAQENFLLESLKLEVANLSFQIAKQREEQSLKSKYDDLPAWLTLRNCYEIK